MPRCILTRSFLVVAQLSLAAAVPGAVAPAGARTAAALVADEPAACCFTNPRYSGVCQVRPSADESCASILKYLNTALSAGKSYCNNTDIRGGWKAEACEKEKTSAAALPSLPTAPAPSR
jgi:hypothetical protein